MEKEVKRAKNPSNLVFELEKNLERFSKTGNTSKLFSNFKKILLKYCQD